MNKLLVSAILCAFLAVPMVGAGNARAANDRSGKTVTASTAAGLKTAQESLKNKEYADALDKLNDMANSVPKGSYAMALVQRLIAYVYIDENKYKKALPHFRKAVDLHQFPKQIQQQATLTLAQIYASVEQYQQAINLLEDWFKTVKKPPTRAYVTAAESYYQLKKLKPARKYIKLAIKKSKKPNKDWYNLLVGVDFQLNNYDEAIDTLRKMISYWPDEKKYWHNLYGLYLQKNEKDKALIVGRIAYSKGFFTDGGDLLNLARLEMLHGMPYYAGRVISKGLKSGKIKSKLDNLQLLVRAWSQADETDKALKTLDKAAKLASDGKLYLKRSQLCYQKGDWDCTVDSAENAIKKGKLDNPGQAWLLKGMGLAQRKKYDRAKAAFNKAKRYKGTKKTAAGWIQYVNTTLSATS
jgi:tetratricopeptide (TPR) repeat protein